MAEEPEYAFGPDHGTTYVPHIGVAGYVVAAGSAFLLLPILPFVAIYYLIASGGDRPE